MTNCMSNHKLVFQKTKLFVSIKTNMFSFPPLMTAVVLVGVFESFAQSAIQWAHRNDSKWHLLIAIACYSVVSVFLYVAYNYKGVGMVNVLWSGMSILLMLTIGYFIFDEKISKLEWLGIVFILIGMMIINICCNIKYEM